MFDDLPAALEWLDSHIDFEAKAPTVRTKPSLKRMRTLMGLLADPQFAYPTIHVTGTNGKGSTAAIISSLVAARGLSVGTYSSPNLSRVNERIARNGEPIDDTTFLEILESLARIEAIMDEPPTRFELLTAAAYLYFADEAVDVAVIEVGIGGTWDCTNVINAEVSVITNVSFDHTEVLGPTLEAIASDKAGIFRSGGVAVIGEMDPGLVDLLTEAATAVGAAAIWVRGREFALESNRLAVGGRLVDVRTPSANYGEVLIPLHGAHQGENASVAIAATEAFFGSPLPEELLESGLATVSVPGRLEVIGRRPLVLVDGAHNPAGMWALSRALDEAFGVEGEMTAVVGMLTGRSPATMMEALAAAGIRSVLCCAPDSPRAQPAEIVADAARSVGMEATVSASPRQAVLAAVDGASPRDGVVICGSLYLVAEARITLAALSA